jgi:hypothetical protein
MLERQIMVQRDVSYTPDESSATESRTSMLTASRFPRGHEIAQKLTKDGKILGRTVGRNYADESNPRGFGRGGITRLVVV